MFSPLQTHALPRASDLGQRKEQNHVCVLFYTQHLHSSKLCSRQTRNKKQNAVTYFLTIVYSISPLISSVWTLLYPLNKRPTKVFKAKSEEGAKSCVCLFLYALYAMFKPLLKAKREEKSRLCDLLIQS